MPLPFLWGKPIFVWLGLLLFFLLSAQMITGAMLKKGRVKLLPWHAWNAVAIFLLMLAHAYFGLKIWFSFLN